jgi:hypothetical protein
MAADPDVAHMSKAEARQLIAGLRMRWVVAAMP